MPIKEPEMLSVIERYRKGEKGFTLVEVLVVLTVFAILFSLTVPNYLRTRPQRLLGGQANKIGQLIRYARLQALRDNQKYYIEFIPELDMYRLWNYSGWRAYADPLRLNGDWDGDGDDFTDGEDADLMDGVIDDPDILLNPLYPANLPLHTVAPKLKLDTTGGVLNDISRDLDDPDMAAGQTVFPYDLDLRMEPLSWNPGSTDIFTRPTWTTAVNILSRGPLLFMVFFSDGTVGSSWQFDQAAPGLADEIRDLEGGQLGVSEIFLQVRGDLNTKADDLYPDPSGGNYNGPFDPPSHWETLEYDKAIEASYGRRIIVNHATGRIKVEEFAPRSLDIDQAQNELVYF